MLFLCVCSLWNMCKWVTMHVCLPYSINVALHVQHISNLSLQPLSIPNNFFLSSVRESVVYWVRKSSTISLHKIYAVPIDAKLCCSGISAHRQHKRQHTNINHESGLFAVFHIFSSRSFCVLCFCIQFASLVFLFLSFRITPFYIIFQFLLSVLFFESIRPFQGFGDEIKFLDA